MAQDNFYKWVQKEAMPKINYVINSNVDLSTNIPKQNAYTLYSIYLQKKLFNQTKGLVWATWFLAMATIILAIISLFIIK